MLLIDIGLTILGGPKQSPSSFLVELLSLPKDAKNTVSDVVFCRNHASADALADDVEDVVGVRFTNGQREQLAVYWDAQVPACTPLPGAAVFCDFILEQKIPYSIVSNLWNPFHQALRAHLPAFEAGARKRFLSYRMGARKPSDGFYSQVYSGIGVAPERCLIVGDSLHNDVLPCLARGTGAVLLASERFTPEPDLGASLAGRFPGRPLYFAADHKEAASAIIKHYSGEFS